MFFYQTYADQITSYNKKKSFSVSIPLPLILWESEGSFSSFHFFILNLGSSIFDLFFWLYSLFISFRFFPLPLSLSSRYSVCINRELFPLYESILFHSNFFPKLPKKNPELDPKWISLTFHVSETDPIKYFQWQGNASRKKTRIEKQFSFLLVVDWSSVHLFQFICPSFPLFFPIPGILLVRETNYHTTKARNAQNIRHIHTTLAHFTEHECNIPILEKHINRIQTKSLKNRQGTHRPRHLLEEQKRV